MGDGSEEGVGYDWLSISTCGRLAIIQTNVNGFSACEEPGEGERKESEDTVQESACSLFRTTGEIEFTQVTWGISRDDCRSENRSSLCENYPDDVVHIIKSVVCITASLRFQSRPQT